MSKKKPTPSLPSQLHEAGMKALGLSRVNSPHDPATIERLTVRLRETFGPEGREFTPDEAVRDIKLAAAVWRTARHELAAGHSLSSEMGRVFAAVLHRVEHDASFTARLRKALTPKKADRIEAAAVCADLLDVGPLKRGENRQGKIADQFDVTPRTLQRRRAKKRGPGKPGRPEKKSDT